MTGEQALRESQRIHKEIRPLNKRLNALMKKVNDGSITTEEKAEFAQLSAEIRAKLSLAITIVDGGMPE